MRAAQLWHWIYFRGARDFAEMLNVAKPMRAMLAEGSRSRARGSSPSRCPPTGRANGSSRMDPAGAMTKASRSNASISPRATGARFCGLLAGRLHADLTFCHTRHAEAGAQSYRGEISADDGGARPPGDFRAASRRPTALVPSGEGVGGRSPTSCSWAWASRSIISTCARGDRNLTEARGFSLSKPAITVSTSGVRPQFDALGREWARCSPFADRRRRIARQTGAPQQKYPIADCSPRAAPIPGRQRAALTSNT